MQQKDKDAEVGTPAPQAQPQSANGAETDRPSAQAPVSVPAPAGASRRPTRVVSAPRSLNVRSITHAGITWIDIVHPGDAEINLLRRTYNFHPLHLDDTLSKIQRPKIDDADDYTFIVLHFPVYNRLVRVTTPSEVDIFVGPSYFITVHAGNLKPLLRFFKECAEDPQERAEAMGRSTGYLLYMVTDKLVDSCFPILNKISANIEQIEDDIFEEKVRKTVYEISVVRRDIIAFRRIIKPLIPVISSLERRTRSFLNEDMEEYFGDISDHLSKIWDTLEDYKEVIEGLSDTVNSLTSNRINEIIKVLTIISVFLLPLTLISGIFGMNVPVFLEENPYALTIILGIMLSVSLIMLGIFKWKKWI